MNPEQLIDQDGFKAVQSAIDQADAERIEATGQGYDPFFKELVEFGARDTGRAIEDLLPGRPIEERVEAIKDHRTLMALGLLASRNEEEMQNVLVNASDWGAQLKVETDRQGKPYLRMSEYAYDSPRVAEIKKRTTGCPFAALNGDKLPSLPYVQFATWAGEVMIRLDRLDYENRRARGY